MHPGKLSPKIGKSTRWTYYFLVNTPQRKKNPVKTKQIILQTAAKVIHLHGYKGLRIDEVVRQTGLTKGAVYHHFPNKQALGYAVVDELLSQIFYDRWQFLVKNYDDPLDVIAMSLTCPSEEVCLLDIEKGCPLTNLAQEMSYEDEGFRRRINNLFDNRAEQITKLLQQGIIDGVIEPNIDPSKTAYFLIAAFQGIQCSSKCSQNLERYTNNTEYLQTLVRNLRI